MERFTNDHDKKDSELRTIDGNTMIVSRKGDQYENVNVRADLSEDLDRNRIRMENV